MKKIKRVSPVVFNSTPLKTKSLDNWEVVLEYKNEGDGPHIVDLSHRPRFDLQTSRLDSKKPFGISIPKTPGNCIFENGLLANRMNKTQVSLYSLHGTDHSMPKEPEFTDITDSTLCVALMGKSIFLICEKLTALDFMDPKRKVPFLFQGPFSHVPCQIVTLRKENGNTGLILTCSRGYSRDMIHSILHAGEEFGLKPAGENKFLNLINT